MDYDFEYLEYSGRLSFKDVHGIDARFECYQRIRVLAPELEKVQDRFWGDGDQLFEYVSPNAANCTLVRLNGKTALISRLPHRYHHGDEIELRSIRQLHHAFKDSHEWWEFTPFVPHERVRLSISFPLAREPEGLSVVADRGTAAPFVARPGTKEFLMIINSPAVGSLYRTEWDW